MKSLRHLTLGLLLTGNLSLQALNSIPPTPTSYVDLVNPLIGSESSFALSSGNTYPVISRPWGMNSWTPQTGKMGDGWQYTYQAMKLRGIKQTHQPSPWINDYGQFSLLPMIGKQPIFDEDKRASWFSHKAESARPYAYEVYLADYDTHVRMAPSERAAVFEVDFSHMASEEERWIVIDAFDANSELQQIDSYTVAGISRKNSGGVPANFANYFIVRFIEPIQRLVRQERKGKGGQHALVAVNLKAGKLNTPTTFYAASSFISRAQAQHNLREVLDRSFSQVSEEGRAEWEKQLRCIAVTDSPERMRTFYSCLYRSLLFPRRFYEIEPSGEAIHYSPYNGEVRSGYLYTDTGYWDTFRALMPLIHLVYPEEGAKMAEGMMNAYRESGFFPEWASPGHRDCMVGNNSASVIADAYLKGLGQIDGQELIKALLHGANSEHPTVRSTGRLGYKYYNKLGYIPSDVGINEHAARSLEYAYDDWCILQALKKAGVSPELQGLYAERAMNYRKLYDPSLGWMRGRRKDASFQSPFSIYKWGDAFTEGNSLHYSWSVFHDIQGLIDLMGGDKAFTQKLDSIFTLPPIFDDSYYGFVIHEIREMQLMNMGNYAHGNQPIQHMIYLYDYAGAPAKAQYWVREVMRRLYTDRPDGYCGDEDNGQTSAWYVFSALGFYPVTPALGQYAIGTPYFREVRLTMPENKEFIIRASDTSHPYIQSAKLNEQPWEKTYLDYETIRNGGTLIFQLGAKASTWGTKPTSRPYSFSRHLP